MLGKIEFVRKLALNFCSLCQHVAKMDIVRVFSFTAISTLVKMLTGLIGVKVVASVIGPAGVALVGQLNNFASIAMAVSSGGINSGIIKYVAEYKDNENRIRLLLSTALTKAPFNPNVKTNTRVNKSPKILLAMLIFTYF